ncbi:MAG: hypothetical protein MUF63_06410 [Rhodobacteraceae bacterium]|jgi:hypothetical protein|nr:hypothetical protein [Paracoccaceae bacterium]
MFRRRQAIADLTSQKLAFPLATVRRIGAGIGLGRSGTPDLQRRLEWHFSGKAPVSELRRDSLVKGMLLMASALPEDDFEPFLAATVLLLLERLSEGSGRDDGFWNWRRLSPHYRLAAPPTRAAIMCGLREAQRMGLIDQPVGPSAEDCLTTPRDEVLAALGRGGSGEPLLAMIGKAILDDVSAAVAGDLWTALHRRIARLPDTSRRAAAEGFRYLYERPRSMESSAADVPAIPSLD